MHPGNGMKDQRRSEQPGMIAWLPDFCSAVSLFPVILLAELVALIAVLIPADSPVSAWDRLGPVSLFALWIALVAAAILCLLKRQLRQLGPGLGGLAALSLVAICSWGCSSLALLFRGALQLPPVESAEFQMRVVALSVLVAAAALRYGYMHEQWKQQVEAKARAELEALQARIRPHFLFNTLNVIAAMVRSQPQQAEEAVLDLADLLRAALRAGAELVPVAAEIELAQRYLAIEKLRLGERLQVQWRLDGLPESARLPPLSLQPLVENAIYHGIQPRPEGGLLEFSFESSPGLLRLCLRNPLPGTASAHGHGIAQPNVRLRLQAALGPRAGLETRVADGHYLCTLLIPLPD